MAYEDVPLRIVTGEAVPASEIIGYMGAAYDIVTRLTLNVMVMMTAMERIYEDETVKYQLTSYGIELRESFLVRLDEECPECP